MTAAVFVQQRATSFQGKCNLSKWRLKILDCVLKFPLLASDFQKDNSMELSTKLRHDVKKWHHFRNEICLHQNWNLLSKHNLWLTDNFTTGFFFSTRRLFIFKITYKSSKMCQAISELDFCLQDKQCQCGCNHTVYPTPLYLICDELLMMGCFQCTPDPPGYKLGDKMRRGKPCKCFFIFTMTQLGKQQHHLSWEGHLC